MARNRIFIIFIVFFTAIVIKGQAQASQVLTPDEQAIAADLHTLVLNGDTVGLQWELYQFPEYIDATDDNGYSLLQSAARINNLRIVELLLEAGADVNFQNDVNGRNAALHYARSPAVIQKLIDYGANKDIRNARGNSPLLMYVTRRNLSAENIRVLLKAGANIHTVSPDRGRLSALHLIFKANMDNRKGHRLTVQEKERIDEIRLEIAKDLIAYGIDVDVLTEDGFTALHFAARSGDIKGIEFLVNDEGANMDIENVEYKQTPMMYALGGIVLKSVEKLLLLGARFDIEDHKGYTVEELVRKYVERDKSFIKLVHLIDQIKKENAHLCALPLVS